MSMHNKPLTPLEDAGLLAHGLPRSTQSQLSDCFRQGVTWALQNVQIETCKLGAYGTAYDGPLVCRAYTQQDSPGNGPAWKLGRALTVVSQMRYGDEIDRGLNLLKALADEGFGVFELPKKG